MRAMPRAASRVPRIAVIGLGDIAGKAYLPVLAARDDVSLVLVSRNDAARTRVGDRYRLPDRHASVEVAIAAGLDAAFVHVATEAHVDIVGGLLRAGVPVFVDKPLAYDEAGAAGLVELSQATGVPLMVGFNRRYAPAYAELAAWPQRDYVVMQKNRPGPLDGVRQAVFDDFIHVVDTVRLLGPTRPSATVSGEVVGGQLRHVSLSLTDGATTAIGLMSRSAGLSEESLEVMAPGRKRRVVNLAEVVDLHDSEQLTRRDEWQSVGVQRGFAPMCDVFLTAIRGGPLPDIADALATHALCERIVGTLEATA